MSMDTKFTRPPAAHSMSGALADTTQATNAGEVSPGTDTSSSALPISRSMSMPAFPMASSAGALMPTMGFPTQEDDEEVTITIEPPDARLKFRAERHQQMGRDLYRIVGVYIGCSASVVGTLLAFEMFMSAHQVPFLAAMGLHLPGWCAWLIYHAVYAVLGTAVSVVTLRVFPLFMTQLTDDWADILFLKQASQRVTERFVGVLVAIFILILLFDLACTAYVLYALTTSVEVVAGVTLVVLAASHGGRVLGRLLEDYGKICLDLWNEQDAAAKQTSQQAVARIIDVTH